MGWGALPNLDFHYVGVIAGVAHTGSKSLCNNGTTCFTIMPDEGINYGADSVWLTFWYNLHNNTDFLEVGYLTDASDSSTFQVLDTVHDWSQEWHFHAVDLSSVPTGARIAFFGHDIFSSDGTFWLDNIHLTSTPCAAWGLRVAENREDSVRLEWESAGDPTVTLTINWNTDYNVTGNSFSFARNYYNSFMSELIAQCPYSGCMAIQPHSQMFVPRYREGTCLDVTDYNSYSYSSYSSMAIPFYGTPVEPYLHTGTYTTTTSGITGIYAGSHTINTNPGSDGGGMMVFPRTIPPGDNVTLRLGNRLGDWESASVLYTITVDTNESDLLVMKYTVAMAFGSFQGTDVAHRNDTLHPAWFRIELLDDTLSPCHQFYIDMWDTVGWDEMNSMYKRRNFTGMAFDLKPYHGQKIHLRVTACDGVVNNRWCYGYYNFECHRQAEVVDACEVDSVMLTAPYGFRYRWYRDGSTTPFDTVQSITVSSNGATYHCDIIDRFNPSCIFTISRQIIPGPYIEVRDTVVENALPHSFRGIMFTGATDTILTIPAAVGCDTTLRYVLNVWPNQYSRQLLQICPNQWPYAWGGHTFTGPDSASFTYTGIHGADSVVTVVAVEVPAYEVGDTLIICPGSPFVYGGIDYGGPIAFDTTLTTIYGCDSLVHVALMPRDTNFSLRAFHSIDRLHWSDTMPVVLCGGQTLHVVDSTLGSTAWQWIMDSIERSSERYASFGFNAADSVVESSFTLVATSQNGCTDTMRCSVVVFPQPTAEFIWTPEYPTDLSSEVQFINYSQPDDCNWLWLLPTEPGSIDYDSLTAFEPVYRWQGNLLQGNVDVSLIATHTMQYDTITHTCADTANHTIKIASLWLEFPNLVTPNGDGINDRWEVVNLVDMGQYPMNEVWIYNLWGVCVFHACNINRKEQFWDPNDTSSPDGTYYFRFMASNTYGTVRYNGVIEVLR